MVTSRMFILTLAALMVGCASAPALEPGQTRDARRITGEEIRHGRQGNAFELVQVHCPGWLRTRGQTTLHGEGNPIIVYLDNQRFGPLDQLRSISSTMIEEMHFLDGREASARYGLGH